MIKRRGRPTQDWKTFIRNHLSETAAIDFLTVPTVLFPNLYVFVVLSLDRRKIIHITPPGQNYVKQVGVGRNLRLGWGIMEF